MDTSSSRKYILVVDDNALIAKVLSNKLTQAGYEARVAANGQEALEAIKERKPDLLLLDLIMPTMDGFTALKELRADPELADLKVIVTSELQQQEDIQKVKELGVLLVADKANLHTIVEQLSQFL